MPSFIDTSVPEQGSPTTASVRDNFSAAKSEIEALQNDVATKAESNNALLSGTTTAATIEASSVVTSTSLYSNGNFFLNGVRLDATAAELNAFAGVNATATEVNYLDGVTSNIQVQLNNKLESNETITLVGDASGSGSTTISVTVEMDNLSGSQYAPGDGRNITNLSADQLNGNIPVGALPSGTLPVDISGDAGSVDGYDIVVTSSPGTDPNTIYFVT